MEELGGDEMKGRQAKLEAQLRQLQSRLNTEAAGPPDAGTKEAAQPAVRRSARLHLQLSFDAPKPSPPQLAERLQQARDVVLVVEAVRGDAYTFGLLCDGHAAPRQVGGDAFGLVRNHERLRRARRFVT